MPRTYKHVVGSYVYVTYTQDTLNKCLNAIRSETLTQANAALIFKIPCLTLKNKLKGLQIN